jgi:hypothetical protein
VTALRFRLPVRKCHARIRVTQRVRKQPFALTRNERRTTDRQGQQAACDARWGNGMTTAAVAKLQHKCVGYFRLDKYGRGGCNQTANCTLSLRHALQCVQFLTTRLTQRIDDTVLETSRTLAGATISVQNSLGFSRRVVESSWQGVAQLLGQLISWAGTSIVDFARVGVNGFWRMVAGVGVDCQQRESCSRLSGCRSDPVHTDFFVWLVSPAYVRRNPLDRSGCVLRLPHSRCTDHGSLSWRGSAGLCSVAVALAATPKQKIIPTITQVSFAAFSRIQADRERVRRNVLRLSRLSSAISFRLFGMAAIALLLVPLLLTERWAEVTIPFQLICLTLPLRILSTVLAPAVMFPIVFIVTTLLTLNALELKVRELGSTVGLIVISATFMGLCIHLLSTVLPIAVEGWTRLAVLVAAGVLINGTVVYRFDRQLMADLRKLRAS